MEIYFVFFFPPQKKKKETPPTLHTLPKPHEPTLQPKLCQRVQFFQRTTVQLYKSDIIFINLLKLIQMRNDRVDGLKAKVAIKNGKKKVVLTYAGKYGQGYDGCGTHTHK